ncbi:PilX N-terminal domain-containing pilus assembly protein [Granulosicoccaceae sp. 1_MG-2023]|nr:PilX N-terminal domain-containing pilus assembly protein [Granulosicoccaceae sp. 1_MG-2023]
MNGPGLAQRRLPRRAQAQRGAILTVALVMMFLLSILGLAVMKTSRLEHRMSTNALHHDVAFQSAETISQDVISDTDNLSDALNSTTGTTEVAYTNPKMDMVKADSTVAYTGVGLAPGYSVGQFVGYRFIVDSTGTIADANTFSRVIQGAVRTAPKPTY